MAAFLKVWRFTRTTQLLNYLPTAEVVRSPNVRLSTKPFGLVGPPDSTFPQRGGIKPLSLRTDRPLSLFSLRYDWT